MIKNPLSFGLALVAVIISGYGYFASSKSEAKANPVAEPVASKAPERNLYEKIDPIYRYEDPDTGCQYLVEYKSALAPRISADGKIHMGCKGVKS